MKIILECNGCDNPCELVFEDVCPNGENPNYCPFGYEEARVLWVDRKRTQPTNQQEQEGCNCFKPDTLVHERCPVHSR